MDQRTSLLLWADRIDKFHQRIAAGLKWLILAMVLSTFTVVVARYLFGFGRVWLQEIAIYVHALSFMAAVGYGVLKNQHVRVDVMYQKMSPLTQNRVEFWGTLLLMIPFALLVAFVSFPYVIDSWSLFEGSKDGGGLEAVFILKSFLLLFALSLFSAALSSLIKSREHILQIKEGR